MMLKECEQCKQIKPITAFRHGTATGERTSICRQCRNRKDTRRRAADPVLHESEKARKREYYRRIGALRQLKGDTPVILEWVNEGIKSYGFEYSAEWTGRKVTYASCRVFKVRGNDRYYFSVSWATGDSFDSRETGEGHTSPKDAQEAARQYLEKERKQFNVTK